MILKADFVKKVTKSCYHGKNCKYVIYIFGRDFTMFFKHCNLILRLLRIKYLEEKLRARSLVISDLRLETGSSQATSHVQR